MPFELKEALKAGMMLVERIFGGKSPPAENSQTATAFGRDFRNNKIDGGVTVNVTTSGAQSHQSLIQKATPEEVAKFDPATKQLLEKIRSEDIPRLSPDRLEYRRFINVINVIIMAVLFILSFVIYFMLARD